MEVGETCSQIKRHFVFTEIQGHLVGESLQRQDTGSELLQVALYILKLNRQK